MQLHPAAMYILVAVRQDWICPLQSTYCKFHSTETALLKLTNDIMETTDSGKITILTVLDMSAAFDTLDHATLLHRLEHIFGLSGFVISWIRPYLTNSSSFVKIYSSSCTLHNNIHRCALGLCPWLTSFCSFHVACCQFNKSWLVRNQQPGVLSSYADDTQLYIGTNASTLVHK